MLTRKFENVVFACDFLEKTIPGEFETFGFEFEMALPPKTSSKLEFEAVLVRFRSGAPAWDFLQNQISTGFRNLGFEFENAVSLET